MEDRKTSRAVRTDEGREEADIEKESRQKMSIAWQTGNCICILATRKEQSENQYETAGLKPAKR